MTHKEMTVREMLGGMAKGIVFEKIVTFEGITYNYIAKEIGISTSEVCMLKSAQRTMNSEVEQKIITVLGIEYDLWNLCVNKVIDLLYKGESSNSIEIWYTIAKTLRDNGKKSQ